MECFENSREYRSYQNEYTYNDMVSFCVKHVFGVARNVYGLSFWNLATCSRWWLPKSEWNSWDHQCARWNNPHDALRRRVWHMGPTTTYGHKFMRLHRWSIHVSTYHHWTRILYRFNYACSFTCLATKSLDSRLNRWRKLRNGKHDKFKYYQYCLVDGLSADDTLFYTLGNIW